MSEIAIDALQQHADRLRDERDAMKRRADAAEGDWQEAVRQRDELYWAALDLPMLTWNDEDSGKKARRFSVALAAIAADIATRTTVGREDAPLSSSAPVGYSPARQGEDRTSSR